MVAHSDIIFLAETCIKGDHDFRTCGFWLHPCWREYSRQKRYACLYSQSHCLFHLGSFIQPGPYYGHSLFGSLLTTLTSSSSMLTDTLIYLPRVEQSLTLHLSSGLMIQPFFSARINLMPIVFYGKPLERTPPDAFCEGIDDQHLIILNPIFTPTFIPPQKSVHHWFSWLLPASFLYATHVFPLIFAEVIITLSRSRSIV